MYSFVCFFPWMPRNYDYVAGILAVFNISADQLVSVRTDMPNNTLVFSVASVEVFNRLQQYYCRVLYFPMCDGRNTLECFAFPHSPQYQFFRISANNFPDNLNGLTAGQGTVLYHRYICHEAPLTADFRSDTIGAVVLIPPASQRLPGYAELVEIAVAAVPFVQVAGPSSGGTAAFNPAGNSAVALQLPIPLPGYFPQQGAAPPPAVYLHQFQIPQFHVYVGADPYDGNFRRHLNPYGNGNHAPAQQPAEEDSGDEESGTSPDEGFEEDFNNGE